MGDFGATLVMRLDRLGMAHVAATTWGVLDDGRGLGSGHGVPGSTTKYTRNTQISGSIVNRTAAIQQESRVHTTP